MTEDETWLKKQEKVSVSDDPPVRAQASVSDDNNERSLGGCYSLRQTAIGPHHLLDGLVFDLLNVHLFQMTILWAENFAQKGRVFSALRSSLSGGHR